MFGRGDSGLLGLSVQYIISKQAQVNVFFAENSLSNWFDVVRDTKLNISKLKEVHRISISSIDDFNELVRNVTSRRDSKATNQNSCSSRSHLVVGLVSTTNNGELLFVDLAGQENLHGKIDHSQTQFINLSTMSLNKTLLSLSKKIPPSFDSALTKMLRPYLSKGATVCMNYHVSHAGGIKTGLLNIKDIVAKNSRRPFSDISNK